MAIWASLTQYLSSRTKRTNLYYMAITTVLCSIFYLIGIWKHGGAASSAALLNTIPCSGDTQSIKTTLTTNTTTANLDFAAHHAAELLVPLTPAAREIQFPPCDPKFSEYTPCQHTERSLKFDRNMLMYRERHCPEKKEVLKCRIPAPHGYTAPFRWPESRDVVWYANVPHKHLTVEKAGQNWVRFKGDRFSFPGGGTMFPRGADAYIDDIGKLIDLGDGSIRTAIDTGCGVSTWIILEFPNIKLFILIVIYIYLVIFFFSMKLVISQVGDENKVNVDEDDINCKLTKNKKIKFYQ